MSAAAIVVMFALVDNVVLARLLGVNPPLGVPGSLRGALGLGASLGVLASLGSLGAWAVDTLILGPLGIAFLRTPVYVFLVAGLAWALSRAAARMTPRLAVLVSFPEAAVNGAVLGAVLIIRQGGYTPGQGVVAGLGAGLGYAVVMAVLAAIRLRLEVEQVPRAMRGLPLQLVSAGLLAFAFLAFDRAFLARLLGGG